MCSQLKYMLTNPILILLTLSTRSVAVTSIKRWTATSLTQCWVGACLLGGPVANVRVPNYIPRSEMCFWDRSVKYITLIHHLVSQCFRMGPSGSLLHPLLYSSIDDAARGEITTTVEVYLPPPHHHHHHHHSFSLDEHSISRNLNEGAEDARWFSTSCSRHRHTIWRISFVSFVSRIALNKSTDL
jgi:hypothetical protein